MLLNIKPLSVNECWQGRRFKTKKYKAYERDLLLILPAMEIKKEKLKLSIELGFSSTRSDIDNPLKPLLDILQKKYQFNDSLIYELNIKKTITKKSEEFIKVEITPL